MKLAFCGVMAALSTVLLFLTGVAPVATLALPAIAGCLLIPVVVEAGLPWAFGVYGVCSVLSFLLAPDREAFPCLRLAEEAAEEGGTACAILNGANEEAVGLFLAEKIGFSDIPRLVAEARAAVAVRQDPSLEDILAADQAARQAVLARA